MTKVSRPNSTLKADTTKGLTRRKGLGASGGRRKRSGFTRVEGYSYEAFCEGIAERDGADCWVRRNVPLDQALLSCDGKLDGHHILAKAWLKRWLFGFNSLASVLNDPRNGILCCRKHHDLLENARIALTADVLPGCVFEFAAELGDRALGRLERDFGERAA